MIQTKQCTNKPKMIKRTTYLEGEWKCVKPMNGEEDETPQQRRRSLLREWKQGRTGTEEETRKKNV